MGIFTRYASPGPFLRLQRRLMPWLAALGIVSFGIGLFLAFFHSPPDARQGETVRIMYVHVPAAWMGMMIYCAMALAAGIGLVARHSLADVFCCAAGPVGAVLVLICLLTGSIWGRPTWGAWWAWDARMTSVLILFLLYCGAILLRGAFEDHGRGFRASAYLLLLGAVNIPVVRFSVDWWNTLHQPASILKMSGPTVDPSMLAPLFVMALGFLFSSSALILLRMKTVLLQRKSEAMLMREVSAPTLPGGDRDPAGPV